MEAAANVSSDIVHQQLPVSVILRILELLPLQHRLFTGRLVCRDACCAPDQHQTASLALPLPPHAAPWAVEAAQQHVRQLPFRHKLQLLCTAAASGCEVNLEVALAALEPSIFPELMQDCSEGMWRFRYAQGGRCMADPGLAALQAGHVHMVGDLSDRFPALLHPAHVLVAAARGRSLSDLQVVWEGLRGECSSRSFYSRDAVERVLNAAAESATNDAVAKMEWVVAAGEGRCTPGFGTLLAAIRSGDPARVQWVREHYCSSCDLKRNMTTLLEAALEHAGLAMSQWLLHEAGCNDLSEDGIGELRIWTFSALAASRSADGAAKHQWLWDAGAVVISPQACALAAIGRGHVDTARYLLENHCRALLQSGVHDCLTSEVLGESGSVPMAEYLYQAGVEFDANVFPPACAAGHLGLIRWLVREAGVSAAGGRALWELIDLWPCATAADSTALLEAVPLLVSAGCVAHGWDVERTLAAAAWRGDLGLVQHLLRLAPAGHVPGREVVTAAVRGGCVALLEWLAEQHPGCLDSLLGDATSAYMVAAKEGDLGTATALRRLGVPWGSEDVVERAVREGCEVPVVRGLWEMGAPMADAGWVFNTVFEREHKGGRTLSSESVRWIMHLAASARTAPPASGRQAAGL